MNLPRLEIIEGDVVKAQLSSQTHVPGRAGVRGGGDVLAPGRVVNHLRVTLTGADGKARTFDFTNTSVAVRDGQRIAVVRAKPAGPGPWLTVALYNLTAQTREEQIGAFQRASRQQWIPARWRAAMWGVGVALVYWPIGEALHLRGHGFIVSAALGVLAVPVAWAIGALADRVTLPARQRNAEKALRFAIDERMARAKADRAAVANAPSATPAPPASPAPKS